MLHTYQCSPVCDLAWGPGLKRCSSLLITDTSIVLQGKLSLQPPSYLSDNHHHQRDTCVQKDATTLVSCSWCSAGGRRCPAARLLWQARPMCGMTGCARHVRCTPLHADIRLWHAYGRLQLCLTFLLLGSWPFSCLIQTVIFFFGYILQYCYTVCGWYRAWMHRTARERDCVFAYIK